MFSFEEIDNLESYEEKLNYVAKNLELIGTGKTRNVFLLNEGQVLKLAKNEDGQISNNVEKHYSDSGWDRLTKVFHQDIDFFWIVSEKANLIDDGKFSEICGISIENFHSHLYVQRILKSMPKGVSDAPESDVTKFFIEKEKEFNKTKISFEIIQKSEELGFDTSDIPRIENLGLVKRKGIDYLAIIDYGNFDRKFRKFS